MSRKYDHDCRMMLATSCQMCASPLLARKFNRLHFPHPEFNLWPPHKILSWLPYLFSSFYFNIFSSFLFPSSARINLLLSHKMLSWRSIFFHLFIRPRSDHSSPGQYVLKIHFFIESGIKMIQFKIQFKTKSRIVIQKNIHSIEHRIFNRIIHSKELKENYSKFRKVWLRSPP